MVMQLNETNSNYLKLSVITKNIKNTVNDWNQQYSIKIEIFITKLFKIIEKYWNYLKLQVITKKYRKYRNYLYLPQELKSLV